MIPRRSLLTVAALVTIPIGGCRPEEERPVAVDVLREGVDLALLQMDTYLTREGIRHARLKADTAEFVGETATEIHLRPVELTMYDTDGTEISVITADFGIYNEMTGDMEAKGSIVVLDRRDDRRLETEQLRYDSEDDRLYGDVAFTLYSDGGRTVIRGAGFQSDPGLDSVRVRSPSGQSERPRTLVNAGPLDSARAAPLDSAAVTPDSADGAQTEGPTTVPDSVAASPDSLSAPPDTMARRR